MASQWPRPVLTAPAGPESSLRGVRTAFEREGDKLYLAPEVLQGRYGKAADMFRFAFPLMAVSKLTESHSFGITVLETASNIIVPGE